MKLIQFGNLSSTLSFPFITPIFQCIRAIIADQIHLNTEVIDMTKHPFVLTFLMFLGCITAGSLEIVTCLRTNTKEKEKISNVMQDNSFTNYHQIKENMLKTVKTRVQLIGIIFCLVLCDLGALTWLLISSDTSNNFSSLEFQLGGSTMIFTAFLSIPILHTRLYKHQITSIGFIVFGIFLVSIMTYIEISSSDALTSLYILGCYFLWSIQEVGDKWIMENRFISPFVLLLLSGTIGVIFLSVLFAVFTQIPCQVSFCEGNTFELIFTTLQTIGTSPSLCILLMFYWLSSVGVNVFLMVTKKLLSPTHKTASDSLSSFYRWIVLMIVNQSIGDNFALALVGYTFIIFGALLFNEIIICYLFGLEVNSKKEVTLRSQRDGIVELNFVSLDAYEEIFEDVNNKLRD